MSAYYFDEHYCEVATLRDGQKVHVRLVRPSDKELMAKGFARMSPEARYRRFFVGKPRLTAKELRYLTELDQVNHVAIGAEQLAEDGDLGGLGVARFVRYKDAPNVAEAAITVIDEMQGKGLGSLLLQRLMAAARERGIRRLRFEVLCSNQPMRDLLRYVTDSKITIHADGEVAIVELDVPDLSPSHPADEPPRRTPLYKLFTMVAKGLVQGRWPLGNLLGLPGKRREDTSKHIE